MKCDEFLKRAAFDEYRAGNIYFGIGPIRIGWDSEGVRSGIQNTVHRAVNSPDFRYIHRPVKFYFLFGGGGLW